MDFKTLISKIDSIEDPRDSVVQLEPQEKIQLDEETAIKFLAGTATLKEAAEIMEKKLTKAEKEKKEEVVKSMKKDKAGFKERYGKRGEEVMYATATKIAKKKAESVESSNLIISELDMNLIKAAQKGQEGKPVGKPDAESDKNVRKKYGYRMDGEPAERDDDETKQDRRGRKRKNTGESIVEANEEGPEDLLAAAEEEYNQPGRHIDNLQDVMNATFGADQSPEFERARDIINRYLEFVTNTDIDHYDEEEDPDHEDEPMIRAMRHGNIQKHIREYDLGDYLAAALSELDKVVRKGESFNRRAFESKFAKMVEAKKQESKKTIKGKKAEEKMDEAAKPDFLDVDKDGDKKEPMKKAAKEAGKDNEKKDTKGLSAKQKKLPAGLQKAIAAKKGKKTVKESFEPKLSFRAMMRLVIESGGQQQIDPLDKTLFSWATRVAQNKFNEKMKAEIYAGLVYERMGGRFEMYDVLSETKK